MNKKKEWIQYIRGRDDQIATGAKLPDIKYQFCRFSGDLANRDHLLMNINTVRLVSVGVFTSSLGVCKMFTSIF